MMPLESGFVYLSDIDSSIIQDIKYFTADNFVGRPLPGYQAGVCITLEIVARAIAGIQRQILDRNLSLKVFDAYRPQCTVDEFVAWSGRENDEVMKSMYYPNISKSEFFTKGYVNSRSAHSRGSAIDLTLVDLNTGHELDMGTQFDFMDEASHPLSDRIAGHARVNRMYLRELMLGAGFEPIATEWWHYRYINEPFPNTYFNFPVI